MSFIKIKPALGALVFRPDGGVLSASGEIVELNKYWRRRLDDGSVLYVLNQNTPAKTKTPLKTPLKRS